MSVKLGDSEDFMFPRNRKWLWLLLTAVLAFQGCWRDPETVKRRYLASGDKYFAQGKYKEASLMYRSALKKDAKFGEAYSKLGETELRRGEIREAIGALRRAVDLLPTDENPAGRLADIYLAIYATPGNRTESILREVQQLSDQLLKRNPNSYHGQRLGGFLAVARNDLPKAIAAFEKADQARPNQPDLLFAMAQALGQNKEMDKAETVAHRIIEKSPHFAPAYDFLMVQYLRNNRRQDADQVMTLKLKNNPNISDFVIQQATFFLATQRRDEAESVLQSLLAHAKEMPDGRMKVGDFYARMRDFDKALAVFAEGYKNGGAQANDYRVRMALVQIASGRKADAMTTVQAVLNDEPKNNSALSLRATLELESGDPAKTQAAITDLQSLLSRQPNNPVVHYNLARAYQAKGELDAAKLQYKEALKRPRFLAAQLGMAQVSLAKKEFPQAIEAADMALKTDPSSLLAMAIKANAQINAGNLVQARTDLVQGIARFPESPDLQFQLALVNFAERKLPEAEKIFRKLLEKYPNDPRLNFATADVLLRTGRGKQALDLLQEQLQKAPDNQGMRYAVAATALRIHDLKLAESEYRKLIEVQPKNFELYMRLGETLREQGQIQQAIEMFRRGQALAPTNAMANLQLGMTYEYAGMRRESLPFYENVLKSDSNNAVALNNLAYLLAEEGRDLDRALTYATRAKQQMPNDDNVSDTLGWVYLKKKLVDSALPIFKDLVKRFPNSSQYRYHLGMALYMKGDLPGAKQSLQAALTLKPLKDDEPKIKEMLAQLQGAPRP
jgi:tetratricopeptide (TPR) repeat protein